MKYADRRGIPVEAAQEIAASITSSGEDDGLTGVRDFLGNFADLAELTQSLPEQAQTALAPHLPVLAMGAASSGQRSNGSDMQQFFKEIVMFKEGMRVLEDQPKTDPASDQLGEYIGTLTERLGEIEEKMFKKQEDERMGELKTFIEALTAKVDEVKEAATSGKSDSGASKKSAVEEFADSVASIEETKKKFRELGLLSDEKKDTSIEDAVQQLRDHGYDVKEPQTYADIQTLLAEHEKKWESEWQSREEQVRQETLDTEERKERNMRLMMDLGSGLLDTIVSAMTARDQSGVTGLMKLKGLIQNTYGAAQAAEGLVGAGTDAAEAAGAIEL